jgi:RNA-directed DNA polymerase
MTWDKQPRLRVAGTSVQRLKDKVRLIFREGKGRSLAQVIKDLNSLLRGWMQYFRLAETKEVFKELDGWLRRKLRCLFWRRWKRSLTRARNLMKRGLDKLRAWKSATNGHGPWWNAGAQHMNEAFPKSYFDRLGFVSLLDLLRQFQFSK